MDDDEISVDLRDVVLYGERMLACRIVLVDVHDHPREIVILPEQAEDLRDALTAALGRPAPPRQRRCGRPKRDGGVCGTPVAREGLACGAHRDRSAAAS